ncbi:MAG: hypothetical protein H6Q90_3921 [Deltaproteobacteria bacterium]|nr:hypothetical protein [Deltaproteobacteria bacterium]
MRSLLVSLAALVALVVGIAACGPSGRDLGLAKSARYQGDKLVLFNAVKTATEAKYKLEQSDETTLSLQTIGRWYTPEGLVATSGDADMRHIPDQSIRISLVVKLLPEGDKWVVDVHPIMMRYYAGRPNPEQLAPKDPSVPGWATGKVDQLGYDIYSSIKDYEVKTVGGAAPAQPAAAAAPADPVPAVPAPAAPAPADPAAPSAPQ